jgi:hypothetical protein
MFDPNDCPDTIMSVAFMSVLSRYLLEATSLVYLGLWGGTKQPSFTSLCNGVAAHCGS